MWYHMVFRECAKILFSDVVHFTTTTGSPRWPHNQRKLVVHLQTDWDQHCMCRFSFKQSLALSNQDADDTCANEPTLKLWTYSRDLPRLFIVVSCVVFGWRLTESDSPLRGKITSSKCVHPWNLFWRDWFIHGFSDTTSLLSGWAGLSGMLAHKDSRPPSADMFWSFLPWCDASQSWRVQTWLVRSSGRPDRKNP